MNHAKASQVLKAIGNECRLQIVTELLAGEKNVSALNKIVKVSQPALSQHLSRLRKAGLIASRRDARQIYYHISDANVVRVMGIVQEMVA